jgi:acylphosphatase
MPASDPEFPSGTEPGHPDSFRALVSGRVQGVGFRFFVIDRARRLGIAGSARNLPDGRVEVLALGPRPALESLAVDLRKGPAMSHVDGLDMQWGARVKATGEFTIGM